MKTDYRLERNKTIEIWRQAIARCEGIVTTRTVQEFAQMVADKERKRCADMVRSMDPKGHEGYIENTADLCDALADAILRG